MTIVYKDVGVLNIILDMLFYKEYFRLILNDIGCYINYILTIYLE